MSLTSTVDPKAMTGLLTHGGADMLRVTVYTEAVPQSPPAELVEAVRPVYDQHGGVRDWIAQPTPDDAETMKRLAAYRAWRSGYAVDKWLGERALVSAFVSWAARRCDVSSLDLLSLPCAQVDQDTALKMRWQMEQAYAACRSGRDEGWGIFSTSSPATPIRAFLPATPPTTILASRATSLSAASQGLVLTRKERDPAVLLGWERTASGTRVDTQAGQFTAEGDVSQLLQIAGRHADQIVVSALPLRTLVASVVLFFRDAADVAVHARAGLTIHTAWT